MSEPTIPREFAHAVVITDVHCRRCGYSQRGLRADGQCPECGLETWQSILHTVDPDASRLPSLHDPAGVGNGLLWLMICGLAATILNIANPVALWLEEFDLARTWGLSALFPPQTRIVAAVVVLLALWSVLKFRPGPALEDRRAIRRDLLLLGGGMITWSIFAAAFGGVPELRTDATSNFIVQTVMSFGGIVALVGLRGVMGVIGLRSREYRTSRGGRQSIEALIAAIAGTVVGEFLRYLASPSVGRLPPQWETYGTMVVVVSELMLVIGLAYLVANSWWIRRALVQPPPTLGEVLLPPLPQDTTIIADDEDEEEEFEVKGKGEP